MTLRRRIDRLEEAHSLSRAEHEPDLERDPWRLKILWLFDCPIDWEQARRDYYETVERYGSGYVVRVIWHQDCEHGGPAFHRLTMDEAGEQEARRLSALYCGQHSKPAQEADDDTARAESGQVGSQDATQGQPDRGPLLGR